MSTDAAPPPESSTPPIGAAPVSRSSRLALLVSVACLVVTVGLWWHTGAQLTEVRSQQREILELIDPMRAASSIDVADAPTLGADDAVVTLIEFSDYECPFCIRHFSQTMDQINESFIRTGRIRYVFKDFPIVQLHPEAVRAHLASRCAAEQGRFWEMHGRMFSPPGSHTPALLEARASEAGVSLEPYRECMASNRTMAGVQASVNTAMQLGANGTPAFFIGIRDPETNRVRLVQALSGAQPFAEFERVLTAVEAQQAR